MFRHSVDVVVVVNIDGVVDVDVAVVAVLLIKRGHSPGPAQAEMLAVKANTSVNSHIVMDTSMPLLSFTYHCYRVYEVFWYQP